MSNLDPHTRMNVVRGLQSEMLQQAEHDRIHRSRRSPSPRSRRQPGRVIRQFIRRLRPAVQQEVR